MVLRVNYEALRNYRSYDAAWLGPIVFPLTFAIIAQCVVYSDIVRHRLGCKKKRNNKVSCIPTGGGDALPPPDLAVDLVSASCLVSETVFGVFCIVQCVINRSSEAFVGLDEACDFQGWYAAYYSFASCMLMTFAIVVGARITHTRGTCKYVTKPGFVASMGLLIHITAMFVASLPLLDVGEYLFATDYCMHNLEGPTMRGIFAVIYFVCLSLIAGAVAVVVVGVRAPQQPPAGVVIDRRARCLLVGSATYFLVAFMPAITIVFLAMANGAVFDSPQWRVYGAQGIMLHLNQLVNPILFGCCWRYTMLGVRRSAKDDVGGGGGNELLPGDKTISSLESAA